MKGKFLVLPLLLWGGMQLSAQTILQQYTAISQGNDVSDMDLKDPTAKGSLLIAMPVQLLPGIKVMSVTDNAPDGGNTYKKVEGAISTCEKKSVEIWYCENCNPGVTELKFHLSAQTRGSINAFLELSNMAPTSALDGTGVHISDGASTAAGQVGPSITTTAKDFIIARFFPTQPMPTGVTPSPWTFTTSYAYFVDAPPGTYQPTLTGGKSGTDFCMSIAAFKTAPPVAAAEPKKD